MKLIDKYYSGGVTAIFNPKSFLDIAALTQTNAADPYSTGTSGSKEKSMFEEQMGKQGDWVGKILPSEIGVIQQGFMAAADLEDSYQTQGLTRAQKYALMQSKYIQRMSMGLMNYKNLEKAKDHLIQSGAAEEVAITSEGYIFVRKNEDITLVPVTKFNPKKDIPLTNAELTNLRANDPRFGFNDKVTSSLMGATSMEEIRTIIQQTTQRLGEETVGPFDTFINPLGEQTENLVGALRSMNISQNDLRTMDLGTLIKQKVKTADNVKAVNQAIKAVMMQLTPQQKALLSLRAKEIGGEAKPETLIVEYMSSMYKTEQSVSLDVLNTFSSGNAEIRAKNAEERQIRKEQRAREAKEKEEAAKLAKNPLGEQKTSGVLRWHQGMSQKEYIEITPGSKGKFEILATTGVVTKNGDSVGITTLNGLAESDFRGSLDLNNATVGGIKITVPKRGHVLVSEAIHKAALPVDQTALRGSPGKEGVVKPDIDACQRMDYAWKKLREFGIDANSIAQAQTIEEKRSILNKVNQVFQEYQLPLLYQGIDPNGNIVTNLINYKEFAILDGYVDATILPNGGKWEQQLKPISEEEQEDVINMFTSQLKKGKYTPPYKYSIFNPKGWFNNPADIYQGAIFIPVNEDVNSVISTTGDGYQPKVPEAVELGRRQAALNRESTYKESDLTNQIGY